MSLSSTNKKISAFIVLFPPIILLIYALVSYLILFNSENKNTQYVISYYKYETKKSIMQSIESRALTVNRFMNNIKGRNIKELSKFLNSLHIVDHKELVLFNKKGKVIFKTANIDNKILDILKNTDDYYESNEIVAFSKYNKKFSLKIVVLEDRKKCFSNFQAVENSIAEHTKSNIRNSLFWLALVWFVLLFISMTLSIVVFNRLREYEDTIQKNNEDIIFQSRQAMLGELLPMIAHQWRQPLNKIASVLMRMRFEISSGNPNIQTLDRNSQLIEDSVELMSQTIEDFRTFYRPKDEEQEVDVSVIIRKSIYFLDELLKRKKIKITHDLTQVKTTLHSNELLQVLINLIKNASDAVSEQGYINIILRDLNNGLLEIRIEDNGTGIPEDKLDKIFEAHESSKQASMGLGLYMSKLIIENRFGGNIKAYNTSKGAGFLIILPKR